PQFVVDTTTAPGNTMSFTAKDSDIQRVIRNAIDTGKLPDPFHTLNGNQAIYAVVTPPMGNVIDSSISQEKFAGYHETVCFAGPCINYAWVGSSFPGVMTPDAFSTTLMHEVVESITDTVPGSGITMSSDPSARPDEIEDGEPQNYLARLGGNVVQSYWSQSEPG